jgi:hypothetical protein
MFSFLEQLNIKFFTQLNKNILKWCKNYRYDFYFELNNEQYIIETHGEQHYEEGFQKMKSKRKSKTLEEEQKNDRLKKELALQNGIKEENYIVIDCRKSTLEWIRDNDNGILNSILSELFDLSKIDWDKVEEFALSNLIKIASEYKNNNPNTTTGMIGELMGYNYHTISNWLKQGTKLGWCNYNPKEEQRRIGKKNGKLSSIRQNQLLIHNENLVQTI